MLVQQYFVTDVKPIGYVIFFGLVLIYSFDRSSEVFGFLVVNTGIFYYLTEWVSGDFKWYQPLVFSYFVVVIWYAVFGFDMKRVTKPLFVELGDITRFPPQLVPDNVHDEFRIYY